jgi:Carboxypeptidase regulatory-like domain/TonB dependent receptor
VSRYTSPLVRTALSAAAAIVVCAPALAQNTTAAINGRIVGADGKPVAAATVTIVHIESRSAVNVTTDSDGRYGARGLRVGGPYSITAVKGGQTEKRDNVFLTLAETTALDLTLGGAPAQTIVVTGEAGAAERFNNANMGAGTNISGRQLQALASIQRSLTDYARTDPRVAQTDKERGEISAAGQNTRYNSITIDGVTTNDTFGLESNNLPTLKQPISIDAIQSVQVNISNYDVTQKGYTGANINAVTKSGTNDLKGSIYYVWRNNDYQGDRFNRATGDYFPAPVSKDTTAGFTLGGPILKDKLFFFGSYEEYKSSRTRPNFGPVGSASTNVGITQQMIDDVIGVARNTWNMDIGTVDIPPSLQVVVKDSLLKLDWNISDDHRASIRYTKTEQTEPIVTANSMFGANTLSLSSFWYNQVKEVESVVGQWFADWTPDFGTELKLSTRDYSSVPIPVNGSRLPQITMQYTGALPTGSPAGTNANARSLNFGTERSRHFNVLNTSTLDAYFGATWTRGSHEIKFGADFVENEIYNAFLQDTNGQYRFQCENGTYTFGTVNCATANAATVAAAALENFRLGRPSLYQVQLPRAGRTINDAVAVWSYTNTGLFVQDTWKLSKDLNVMLGVRMDQQNVPEKPLANTAAAAPAVAGSIVGTTVTRASGGFGLDNTATLDGNRLFQPRVGFNWNLGGKERRMQLRGGLGLFQGAAANVWLSNPFSNTGIAVATFSCASFTACNTANARFSANPDAQPTLTGTIPAANVDFLSPQLEQPSVWKTNLAFDAELPALPVVGKMTFGAEWIHTKTEKGVFHQHLNLGAPTRLGPDGRELYYLPQGLNPACYTATSTAITTGACAIPTGQSRTRALSNPAYANVLLAAPTSKGSGDAITLSLSQQPSQGVSWGVAYTRTSATEVSPLTSSVSNSNWINRAVFNPNEDVAANSNYLIRDRVSANMTWSKPIFDSRLRTTFGVFYEGRKGKPYSWTYLNDMNGDGVTANDLMYIPKGPGSGEVVFAGGAAEEARFWAIVDSNPALAAAKGSVVGRNNSFAPWVNSFDVRFSQELPGFKAGHKGVVTFDILNVGNLLNNRWGRIDEVPFPSTRSFVNFVGLDAAGRYNYRVGSLQDLTTRQTAGESQWAMQVTLRYEF